jgi:glucose dehydrogenase
VIGGAAPAATPPHRPLRKHRHRRTTARDQPRAEAGGGGRGQPQAPVTGLTVDGRSQELPPVTDENLRNPAPGDWLTIRRDHFASNYSPLTQITRDNAQDLQLVWVAPMAEGGTNQPAPLARNGTIFINNTAESSRRSTARPAI